MSTYVCRLNTDLRSPKPKPQKMVPKDANSTLVMWNCCAVCDLRPRHQITDHAQQIKIMVDIDPLHRGQNSYILRNANPSQAHAELVTYWQLFTYCSKLNLAGVCRQFVCEWLCSRSRSRTLKISQNRGMRGTNTRVVLWSKAEVIKNTQV